MRFAALILLLLLSVCYGFVVRFSTPKSLRCWKCEDAGSDAHCFKIGKWVQCEPSQSCYVEQRYANGFEMHKRGCKQNKACETLTSQNEFECNAILFKKLMEKGIKSPIACRHCCMKSYCNPTKMARIALNQIKGMKPVPFPYSRRPRPIGFPTKMPRPTKAKPRPTVPTAPTGPQSKVDLGEVFYPGIGWISLARVEGERPPPPALVKDPKKSSKGNITTKLYDSLLGPVEALEVKKRQRIKKRKETCTSAITPLVPSPPEMKPRDECVIQAPTSCLEDGTLVFQLFKVEGAVERLSPIETNSSNVQCLRTPSMDTAMVYDNNDHYIMVMKIKQRTESQLPERQRGKFFIGDGKLNDVIGKLDLRRFRGGNG